MATSVNAGGRLDRLPIGPFHRRILILIRVDEMPRQEVARRLGVSVSLVDRELRRAHDHVVERMR